MPLPGEEVTSIEQAPQSPNLAPPPTIDMAAYIKNTFGDEVVGHGEEPGTIKIKHIPTTDLSGMPAPSGSQSAQIIQVDAKRILQDAGVDPSKIKYQLGTPEQPMNENPMGFFDRVKFALATEPSNKMKFLKDQYGAENVAFNPKPGQFVVKQGDAYYNATNPGLEAAVTAESPKIAGNIFGSVLGSTFGPAGTIAGGTLGSAIGQIGTTYMAHQMGIRDDVDYDQASKELGKEMLWNIGFGAAPYAVAKVGTVGLNAVSAALEKVNETVANPTARKVLSTVLGKVMDKDPYHVAVMMNNPAEYKAAQEISTNWENARLANAGTSAEGKVLSTDSEINPIKLRMANRVQSAVEYGQRKMIQDYGAVVDAPEVASAASKAKVDIGNLSIQSSGGKTIDPEAQLRALHQSIGDSSPSEAKAIKKILGDLDEARGIRPAPSDGPEGLISTGTTSNTVSYDKAKELIKRTNRVLDAQGAFGVPEMQVSNETQRALTMYKEALAGRTNNGLSAVDQSIGERVAAADAQYAKRKGMLGDLGNKKAFEPGNIDSSLSKLGGPKGERLRQNLATFIGDTKPEMAQRILRRIDIDNAVLQTGDLFDGGLSRSSALKSVGKKAAQITTAKIGQLQRAGGLASFISKQGEGVRTELFNNPVAIQSLVQILGQSTQIEDQTRDQLTQQALQSTAPNGQ